MRRATKRKLKFASKVVMNIGYGIGLGLRLIADGATVIPIITKPYKHKKKHQKVNEETCIIEQSEQTN